MARRALWVCWPLRTVLALSTSPLRLPISSPRHQRGHTEPNLALYGHVWCWAAGGGPGGPYATITPPLLLGDWLAGGWGLSRHSWAGQCPGHVGTWAMLGEFSLHHRAPPPTGGPVFDCSFICLDTFLHLPLLWLLSKRGSEGLSALP